MANLETQALAKFKAPQPRVLGVESQQPLASGGAPVATSQTDPRRQKIEKIKAMAPLLGIPPETVAKFVALKEKEIELQPVPEADPLQVLANSGIPLSEIASNPALQKIQASQLAQGTYQGKSAPDDALTRAYASQLIRGGIKGVTNIPAEDRGNVVKALEENEIDLGEVERAREGEQVTALIKSLYDKYTNNNLAGGRVVGNVTSSRAALGLAPQASTYKSLKKGAATGLKTLTGDTGVLTDTDVERISGLLPGLNSTGTEAEIQFKDIDTLLKSKYGVGIFDDQPTETSAQPPAPTQTAGKVRVKSPEGKVGTIDQAELQDALAAGWTQL